jgi:hypothetical protein
LHKRREVIEREDSQYILEQASIIDFEGRSSFISERTSNMNMRFDFDPDVLSSPIYQRAGRSFSNQETRREQPRPPHSSYTITHWAGLRDCVVMKPRRPEGRARKVLPPEQVQNTEPTVIATTTPVPRKVHLSAFRYMV